MKNEITESAVHLMSRGWVYTPVIFSGFYFAPVFFQYHTFSGSDIIAIIGVYLAFLTCYIKAQNSKADNIQPYLFIMTGLCIYACTLSSGPMALFGYINFIISFYYPTRRSLIANALVMMAILISGFAFFQQSYSFLFIATIIAIANGFMGINVRRQVIQGIKDRKAEQQIEQLATIAERERIARDLHDLLGHTLSSIALKAELASKLGKAGQTEKALAEIDEVAAITRDTLAEVRQAISGYKTDDFNHQLESLKSRLEQVNFVVNLDMQLPTLDAKTESNLLLIIREAVTNIIRHSNGDNVNIQSESNLDSIVLAIKDNGTVAGYQPGNGLTGIKERIESLSGSVEIITQDGFELVLKVPLKA